MWRENTNALCRDFPRKTNRAREEVLMEKASVAFERHLRDCDLKLCFARRETKC
jgi:hypothetical protein